VLVEPDQASPSASELELHDTTATRPPIFSQRDRRWWVWAVVLTLAAVSLGVALGGHRRHGPHLDVFDEGAHYSYVVALRSGHLPAWGDTLTQQERMMADCLGFQAATAPAHCGAKPTASKFYPAQGYDYEAQQPPLGYLPYVLTANPQAQPKAALAAARHGGILWVAASGMLLLVFAALEGLSLTALAALLGTCLLNPVFTYAAGTVNNDAAGLAAGTVALIALALSKRRPRWSVSLGLVSGVLIGMTKGLFVVVPLALFVAAVVVEYPVVRSIPGLWSAAKRNICVLAMLGASTLSYVAWVVLQEARAATPSSTVLHALMGFSHVATLQTTTIGNGVTSILTLFEPYSSLGILNVVWTVAIFGMLFGLWFLPTAGPDARATRGLSAGILFGVVALAIAWPTIVYVQGHYNFAANVRYGIPLLPLIGYVIVKACRRSGIIVLGIALPVACAVLQLAIGQY
jgi:hypothetical protein